MTNLEIPLVTSSQGDVVVKAHNLSLHFDADNGNITVNGQQTIKRADGKEKTIALDMTSIRLKEYKQMVESMQEGPLKTKGLSKIAIWETALTSINQVLSTLLPADYTLENPE